jgi:hypothetical protein
MTDPAAAEVVVGSPQVAVEALVELRDLLDTVKTHRPIDPNTESGK